MDLCSKLCLAGWPAYVAKSLTLDITSNCPTKFIHSCHANIYHWLLPFMPLSLNLTLPGGQGQHKAKHIFFIFLHTSHLIRMKCDMMVSQFKQNILRLLMSRIFGNNWNNCCFTDCIKKRWQAFRCFQTNLSHTEYDDRHYCTLHFDTSLVDLNLVQGHRIAWE